MTKVTCLHSQIYEVSLSERLSNQVYLYDRKSGSISLASVNNINLIGNKECRADR